MKPPTPNRRPDESDDDDYPRPRSGARGKSIRKKHKRRSVLPFVLLGIGALAFPAVGAVVVIRIASHRDKDSTSSPSGAPIGSSGAGASAALGQELLTNGSFEDGPEPDAAGPGFTPMEAGSSLIPGWTVTRGSVDYIGFYWQHADGKRSIDLNGNEPGAIAQTFRTKPGKRYRVTFSMAGNNCGGGEPQIKRMVVSAAGRREEFVFDTTGRNYEDMGWVARTWEFTATATETTLEFVSTTDLPIACGPALDKVSVREVGG
jgi:choice-of-anchor C domain-containing protein